MARTTSIQILNVRGLANNFDVICPPAHYTKFGTILAPGIIDSQGSSVWFGQGIHRAHTRTRQSSTKLRPAPKSYHQRPQVLIASPKEEFNLILKLISGEISTAPGHPPQEKRQAVCLPEIGE